MSTRTNITIRHGESEVILYRHHDGYPAETGADLLTKLVAARYSVGGLLRALMAEEYAATSYRSARPVYELTDSIHGDIEHRYEIESDEQCETVTIRHCKRLSLAHAGGEWSEEWSPWRTMNARGFLNLVNADRSENNARLDELKAKNPGGAYDDCDPYPLLTAEDLRAPEPSYV